MAERNDGTITDYLDNNPLAEGGPRTAWGQPAQHAEGVAYYAPWEGTGGGFPEHCRRNALALSKFLPLQLRSVTPVTISGRLAPLQYTREFTEVERSVRHLTDATIASAWAHVYQIVPQEGLLHSILHNRWLTAQQLDAVNRAKVVYCVLERDRVSDMMARGLNRLGQVWTTCRRSIEALVTSGVDRERIRIVPLPTDHCANLARRPRGNDVPRFYHVGKWEPRKAQDRLLTAFMLAFRPEEAKLVIKTGTSYFPKTAGYPRSPAEAIRVALERPDVAAMGWRQDCVEPSIRVVTQFLRARQIEALHRWGDCYVSLAHGEGWDMPAFDACQMGNLVLRTNSGGPEEFAPAHEHVVVPSCGTIPVDPCYGWGDAGYWDYHEEDAVTGFRRAAMRLTGVAGEEREKIVPHLRFRMRELFEPHRVGNGMRLRLEELRSAPVAVPESAAP